MKFLALVLSFLVMTLSVLPCADENFIAGAEKNKPKISQQHSPCEGENHNDACSPFCHCTCCAGFSINQYFNSTSSLMIIGTRAYISYLPGNLIHYSSPVWQPPKLG